VKLSDPGEETDGRQRVGWVEPSRNPSIHPRGDGFRGQIGRKADLTALPILQRSISRNRPSSVARTVLGLISDFQNFFLTPNPNQHYSYLVPSHRGALRNVTDAERDAVMSLDERRWLRTAKSCGPGAPTLALSFRGHNSRK
jgi:hypothetical protein